MEKYCISVDWLQVYCLKTTEIVANKTYRDYQTMRKFELRENEHHPPMFLDLIDVYCMSTGMLCATIQMTPRSPRLKAGMVLLRMENRFLYSDKYIDYLYSIIRALELNYKGITRIDLCYDCNKFANGRNPSKFLNQFMSKDIDEVGYIYINRIKEFAAHGTKSKSNRSKLSGISFGSRTSRIRSYIYDKTLEMQQVKQKPWIAEYWDENGLISSETEHVYRAEISIRSEGTDLLNMSTSELFKLSPRFLEHRDRIEQLFYFYAKKYFDFRIRTKETGKNKFKELFIFECKGSQDTVKPVHINRHADTGRSEVICRNKLERLSQEYSDLGEHYRSSLQMAIRFISELAGIKQAIIKQKEIESYLDSLRGRRYREADDFAYLMMVEKAHQARLEYDAEIAYEQYRYYMCEHTQL